MSGEIVFEDGDLTLDSNKNITMDMIEAINEMGQALPQDTSIILKSQSFTEHHEIEFSGQHTDEEDPNNTSHTSMVSPGSKALDEAVTMIKNKTGLIKILHENSDDAIIQAYCILFDVIISNSSVEDNELERYLGHNQRYCNIIDTTHPDSAQKIKTLANICAFQAKFWKQKTSINYSKNGKR